MRRLASGRLAGAFDGRAAGEDAAMKADLEYNYYWQNHDNPSNGQCRQLKIYQKYKIKMSKST